MTTNCGPSDNTESNACNCGLLHQPTRPTTLDIPKDSPFGRTFPAAANPDADDYHWTDSVVTQGHADYCKLWGHATWTHDGVDLIRCPRCGDNKCHTDHKFDCGV